MLPEFKKRIDTLRDILVGAVPSPAGQIEQITYALIYKFMSDIDDRAASLPGGKRTYFTAEYKKYGWHELMTPTLGAHDRLTLYREALSGLAKNPGLPVLFQEIYQNAYLTFNDPRVLTLFLKKIDEFEHSSSDDIGDAYEYLLQITGAQGDVGQFRTPRHIIKFIVEAVNPTKDDSVLDPAVGTAGFLIAAYSHVKHHHDGIDDITGLPSDKEKRLTADELDRLHKNYHGFDIDPTMVRTAKVNMYLHGFKTPDIKNHDSLSSEDYWTERYDVILANPPFMSPKGGIKPHKKFGITANRAEVLFVDYIASHLKPTGRAGIVVPEGVIFQGGNAYKELRKNLVDNYLCAVVSLPAGVFQPYSGVKTSVLLLDKELASKRDDVLFIKVENDGYSLSAQRHEKAGSQLPDALKYINAFKSGVLMDDELGHIVAKSVIAADGNYSLSGDRYKKDKKSYTSELSVVTKNIASQLEAVGKQIKMQTPDLMSEVVRMQGLMASSAFSTLQEAAQATVRSITDTLRYMTIPSVSIAPTEIQKLALTTQAAIESLHAMQDFRAGSPLVLFNDNELFQIESGGTPSSKIPEYWNGDVAWATLADLPSEDLITVLSKTKRTITEGGVASSSAKILPPQSILISSRATIGRVAISEIPIATNQGFKNIIIKDTSRVDPKFTAYMVTWLKDRLQKVATGGTFTEFTKKDLLTFGIPLPLIEVQREIVAELDDYQEIINAAQTIVRAYKPTIKINPEWPMKRLADITERITKGTTPTTAGYKYQVEGINFIKVESITPSGDFIEKKFAHIDDACHKTFKRSQLKTGDVLFSIAGALGRVAVVNEAVLPANTNQALAIITPKEGVESSYLSHVLCSNLIANTLEGLKTGVAQSNLSLAQVSNFNIPVPAVSMQKRIVTELEAEQFLIDANKKLIEVFQQKIKSKIAEVWGE